MKSPTFSDWIREQFLLLMGDSGEPLWSEAEELRKRRKLIDASAQEGRFVGKFSGEKPTRAELIVPVFSEASWQQFLEQQERSAEVAAHLFASLLPWQNAAFQEFLSPAGFIPKDDQASGPGAYSTLTTLLLQELCTRLEEDPFILFQLRGRGKDELFDALRTLRGRLFSRSQESSVDAAVDEEPLERWEFLAPELLELSYSLRADELPAILFKKVESIPLPGKTELAESALSELYVHIAKRAQAYGLSFRNRA